MQDDARFIQYQTEIIKLYESATSALIKGNKPMALPIGHWDTLNLIAKIAYKHEVTFLKYTFASSLARTTHLAGTKII